FQHRVGCGCSARAGVAGAAGRGRGWPGRGGVAAAGPEAGRVRGTSQAPNATQKKGRGSQRKLVLCDSRYLSSHDLPFEAQLGRVAEVAVGKPIEEAEGSDAVKADGRGHDSHRPDPAVEAKSRKLDTDPVCRKRTGVGTTKHDLPLRLPAAAQ